MRYLSSVLMRDTFIKTSNWAIVAYVRSTYLEDHEFKSRQFRSLAWEKFQIIYFSKWPASRRRFVILFFFYFWKYWHLKYVVACFSSQLRFKKCKKPTTNFPRVAHFATFSRYGVRKKNCISDIKFLKYFWAIVLNDLSSSSRVLKRFTLEKMQCT